MADSSQMRRRMTFAVDLAFRSNANNCLLFVPRSPEKRHVEVKLNQLKKPFDKANVGSQNT
jgi:hypothetical protein